jgi:hypothetical protein
MSVQSFALLNAVQQGLAIDVPQQLLTRETVSPRLPTRDRAGDMRCDQ